MLFVISNINAFTWKEIVKMGELRVQSKTQIQDSYLQYKKEIPMHTAFQNYVSLRWFPCTTVYRKKNPSLRYLLGNSNSPRPSQQNRALAGCPVDALYTVLQCLGVHLLHILALNKWGHITAPNSDDLGCSTYSECHKFAFIKHKTSFTAHWNTSAALNPNSELIYFDR